MTFVPDPLQADYGVSIGEIFDYDIVSGQLNAEIGTNSLVVSGINLGEVKYQESSVIEVVVNNITEFSVLYNISCNDLSSTGEIYESSYSAYSNFIILPVTYGSNLAHNWQIFSTFYSKGIRNGFYPFLNAEQTTWDYFEELNNEIRSDISELGFDVEFSNDIDDGEEYFSFEFLMIGNNIGDFIAGTETTSDGSFQSQIKGVYHKTSGVLYGVHYLGSLDGTINGVSCKLSLQFQIELTTYDMEDFILSQGTKKSNGLTWILIPVVFSSFYIIREIIIEKRKR
jgi:hypothetical protein